MSGTYVEPVVTPAHPSDCGAPYDLTSQVRVRCTAVRSHFGLHRAHIGGEGAKRSLLMWGESSAAVSVERLSRMPNPLGLLPAWPLDTRAVMEQALRAPDTGVTP